MSCLSFSGLMAQTQIEANFNVRHKVGNVDSFDRPKFINFHGTYTEAYWDKGNENDNLRKDLLEQYDVYLGRDTGGLKSTLNDLKEDQNRPGYADPEDIARKAEVNRKNYANKKEIHAWEKYSNLIVCNQFHPLYPDGTTTAKHKWSFSQADTDNEPFGTASGEFYGRYIQENFKNGGKSGAPMPDYCEIINEPLWDIYDKPNAPKSSITKLFEFHATVAKQVRKYNPKLPIGGYCTAFPDFEYDNFNRWNQRWKHFIDIAGEEMDFWTIHLYDFPSINGGKQLYRKGSNMEATMDMIEQYSHLRLGEVKPLMISEYSAQTHDYNKVWSPYRDWLRLKSTNSMLMQFLERANNINVAMPFTMLRSDWGYNAKTGQAHTARMLRREDEPNSFTGEYVYSELVKFYQQWKDVKGTRVDTYSDNPDIMVDAYVDGNKAYLIINNLDFKPINLDVDLNKYAEGAENIEVRHLYLKGAKKTGVPVLDIKTVSNLNNLEIGAEATYVIALTYPKKIKVRELNEEVKYYATSYLKEIQANQTLVFDINDVKVKKQGEAILRLGVGRDHGKTLRPVITVNGQKVEVPSNFRGDTQKDRKSFFGVLEIPVDYALLRKNNEIKVTFPDAGGHVSTTTMQVFNFSSNIR